MKKLVLAVAALGLISLTSCKKDYTCTCTGTGKTSVTIPYNKMKKSDAKKGCDAALTIYTPSGYSSCTL